MTPTIKYLALGIGDSKLWCFLKIETNAMPNRWSTGPEVSALETSHTSGKLFTKHTICKTAKQFFCACIHHEERWQNMASHNNQAELALRGSGLAFHPSLSCGKAALDPSFQSILHVAPQHGRKPAHCHWAHLLCRIYISTQKPVGIHKSKEIGEREKKNPWIRPIF